MPQYASLAELATMGGLPGIVLDRFPVAERTAALENASALAEDALRSRAALPLTGPAPMSIRLRVCQIAAYFLLSSRGFDPGRGSDANLKTQYDDALEWLEKVAAGDVALGVIPDQTPELDEDGPWAFSEPSRGL